MSYSQFAATSQFYLYGTRHFNQTGYLRHVKENEEYKNPDEKFDLSGKVIMVTGANSGIGKEIAKFVASKGATLYMVCRNAGRAEKAKNEIVDETKNDNVHVLQVDCSLESSVRAGWASFLDHQKDAPRLDGLVCNAGVLLNERTLTDEGIEVTFACHLLFGTYLLGSLALPLLGKTNGRLVVIASGGMYNTKYPGLDKAASLQGKYDGNLAYAYAKRGQVLLCEQWADANPEVKVVSAHPGWTLTDAVDAAYGDQKKYLEPMRTPWEGSEGIGWLLACEAGKIETGAFYLDRKPQTKHMAGPFFTEGSFTKNSPEEVKEMMKHLDDWANGRRPGKTELVELHEAKIASVVAGKSLATPLDRVLDIKRFMGRWYVIAHIPTFLDKGTANNTEDYEYDDAKQKIKVTFTYSNLKLTKTSSVKQIATPVNEENTNWKLKIALVPFSLPYTILDCAEDYSTCIVGEPKRSFLYIMARTSSISDELLNSLRAKALRCGYDIDSLVKVPQTWPDA